MTIEELIKELKNYPPKSKVYQSIDEEGNAFHEVYEVGMENEYGTIIPVIWPGKIEEL